MSRIPSHPPITLAFALAIALLLPGAVLADDSGAVLPSTETVPAVRIDTRPAWIDAIDLSGYVAIESRSFLESESYAGQETGNGGSLVLNPELYREWRDGDEAWAFEPFLRVDSVDRERSHWDIRELSYTRVDGRWEFTLGMSRVFWGVTESQHLVDIINQTDLVENPDGEDKLGQPMLRSAMINNWGIIDVFVLPGFRERTFPGEEGRLRPGLPIDTDNPIYESSAGQWHTDWAVRWSHAIGAFDLGLSYFSGTSREPLLVPSVTLSEATGGRGVEGPQLEAPSTLLPYYPQITQLGLNAQATLGSWLLKAEAIRRSGFEIADRPSPTADFTAATYGFEYTFWSAFDSKIDIGALAEHLWDARGAAATSPFQNDLFVGTRLAFNDTQSSELLGGIIYDLDNQARLYLLEASRRFGSSWKVELEFRGLSGQRPMDPLASLRTDDYLQLSIQRHF